MEHIDLAKQFNSFAYELAQEHMSINDKIPSISNTILLRRIIFNKYYYALYHKYLSHDSDLSSKSGSSIHDAILKKIRACKDNDQKLYQVYLKLLNLRVWADYKLDDNQNALTINLATLNNDVWSIMKRKTISC